MKNSKLSRGDYSVICQKCASSIDARYDYQPDYSRVSVSPGRDSLSTGERDDPAEAPPGAISAENHEPDAGYHADAEDNFYRDDAVQSNDPDALYEPGNGYHTDDEIREDEQRAGELSTFLPDPSGDLPRPLRKTLVNLAAFIGICLVVWFWTDQPPEQDPPAQYDAPATSPLRSLDGSGSALRSGAVIPSVPAGNPGGWISSGDYPVAALREERSGAVEFQLRISESGEVTACDILASSGHADLDTASCRALMRRARFSPARNASGQAVSSSYTNTVRWQLP
ncbi:energy transducer TonB [Sphingorhabdus sp. YGSMI21]|uniref:energy transducer TonB n=1 Tax=Sphingorhabdus sp. YGSMI21 TaxID=2077182 RepID=UPI0013DABD4A|nr:energy transducer TonB [Sphingorhabdus sp. YGSMI21]